MASITSLSNSNYNTSSIYGNRNVLSGLASGMDTETMIENAVSGIKMKIQNLLKKRTKVEWQQEAYRSIIDKAANFNQKYTSYSSKTNLLSNSFFNNAVNTTTLGTYKDKITASGKTTSDIQINAVKQMAKAATYTVSGLNGIGNTSVITGTAVSPNKEVQTSNVQGTISIDYGRYSFDVTLDDTVYSSLDDMAKAINEQLADVESGIETGAKASKYVEAKVQGGKLVFAEKESVTGPTKGNSVSAALIGKISGTMSAEKKDGTTELSLKKDKTLSETSFMRDSLKDKTLNLTLDGVTKSINLKDLAGARDDETFQTLLKDEVKKAFGEKVSVNFTDADSDGFKISFEAVQDGSTLSVSGTAASSLGFSSGDGNFINTGKKISELLENKLGDAFKPANRMRGEFTDEIATPQQKTRSDGSIYYVDAKGNYVDKDGDRLDKDGNAVYEFKINDASIEVTKETTLESLMNAINSNPDAGVKVNYSKLTNEFKFTATEMGANGRIEFGGLAKDMFVNHDRSASDSFAKTYDISLGEKIGFDIEGVGTCSYRNAFDENSTIQDVVDRLNRSLNTNHHMTASFDELSGQIMITDDKSGKAVEFKMVDEYENEYDLPEFGSSYTAGQDAIMDVEINGKRFENLARSSNTFDIDGLSINVKGTFNVDGKNEGKDGAEYEAVTFNTATDTDKIIDVIREFVNDYNEMATELKNAYSTMPAQQSNGSRYEPLTAEQEEGMTESELKAYNEKAKQGILFSDSTLSGMYSKLLSAITPGGTDGQTLREIGIGTSYSNGMTTLSLDEDKLRSALERDPDKVRNAFAKTKEGGASSDGLMQTMQNALNTYVRTTGEPKGALIQRAGSIKAPTSLNSNSLKSQMDTIDNQIERWQNKMSSQIDRYTTQFSRLEQLIAQMNSQSSAMSGLMGGSSGY